MDEKRSVLQTDDGPDARPTEEEEMGQTPVLLKAAFIFTAGVFLAAEQVVPCPADA
jgi:hypothetical protein